MSENINSTRREQLLLGWRDPEYRAAFVDQHVNNSIAFQTRSNREQRGWLQEDLAKRLGKYQSWVSVLENPNYGKHSLGTLKAIARVFDCVLEVRFRPFSYLLDYLSSRSSGDLVAVSFDEDNFALKRDDSD